MSISYVVAQDKNLNQDPLYLFFSGSTLKKIEISVQILKKMNFYKKSCINAMNMKHCTKYKYRNVGHAI